MEKMEKMSEVNVDADAENPTDYMLDKEMDLLGELGDCHKTKLAGIDVEAKSDMSHNGNFPMVSQATTGAEDTTLPQEEESDLLPLGLVQKEGEEKTLCAIQALDKIIQRMETLQCRIRRFLQLECGTDKDESQMEKPAT
ncbi:uncharacterized protein LOC128265242 [Drosophila gunungcola]|uniref:uncharacterized protein LOC128265242 n=1 Tax=Drosophila gunungcola TaxID=103775 RepID=UPI0022E0979B|nr:uncharacterized protein LOC128265242 [Drosophila gunungcola]